MLNKNKFFSILIISLFLISCIIGFYTPKVKSQIVDNLSYYTSLGDGTYNIPYVMSANNGIVFYLTAPIYGNGEYLSGVQFLLKNEGGTATGYLTAFLANDSIATDSHVENVIQNSSTVFNVVSLPNAYYLVEFIFNKTQQLTNGTTYYLGLTEFGITNMLGQLGTGVIDICGINPSMYNYYPNDVNTLYGSFNNVPEPNLSGFCISYNVYTNREFNYRGILSADDNSFKDVQIAFASTEVDLPQQTNFNYTGLVYYINGTALSIGGNFSVGISALSATTDIFSSYVLSYTPEENFSGNSFNFTIGEITSTINKYQVFNVNFTLSNGEKYSVFYNIGFLTDRSHTIGSGGNGSPTPTPLTVFGLGALGISNSELAVAIYAICIISLIIAFYYLHNNNVPFAFCLGLILATIICQIVDILGIYTYPIDVLITISVVGIIIFMRH
jgi:hypothetical protein